MSVNSVASNQGEVEFKENLIKGGKILFVAAVITALAVGCIMTGTLAAATLAAGSTVAGYTLMGASIGLGLSVPGGLYFAHQFDMYKYTGQDGEDTISFLFLTTFSSFYIVGELSWKAFQWGLLTDFCLRSR